MKEIKIKDLYSIIIKDQDILKCVISEKIINIELKMLIYYYQELKIKVKEYITIDNTVVLKIGNDKIEFTCKEDGEYYKLSLKDKEKLENDLFDKATIENIEKYKKETLKYYVEFLLNVAKYNNKLNSSGKLSAMLSYNMAKKYFEDKNIKVSRPNVFINGLRIEFDALLLKKDEPIIDGIYNYDDVLAIIEIKTCGWFGNFNDKKKDERSFKNYINYEYITDNEEKDNIDKKEEREKEKERINEKPYIYFCPYETNSGKKKCYENSKKQLSGEKYGIFFFVKENQQKIIVPDNSDIERFIENVN